MNFDLIPKINCPDPGAWSCGSLSQRGNKKPKAGHIALTLHRKDAVITSSYLSEANVACLTNTLGAFVLIRFSIRRRVDLSVRQQVVTDFSTLEGIVRKSFSVFIVRGDRANALSSVINRHSAS